MTGAASAGASTAESAPPSWPPTRVAAGLIFVSGQLAVDDEGQLVGPGDWAAQAAHSLWRIERELARFGASMADVVRLTTFVVDAGGFAEYARVRRERYPDLAAAGTTVVVSALLVPGALMEIEATARQPGAGATEEHDD
jgi:enamine deaminase RidA (YjgF/YER057c/UK114 family)